MRLENNRKKERDYLGDRHRWADRIEKDLAEMWDYNEV
jgi:hypothetical protein